MKNAKHLVIAVAAVAGLITFGIVSSVNARGQVHSPDASVGATVTTGTTGATGEATNERHPHIHHAIKALEAARIELKEAAHDFGGHRVDALKAVDDAIAQLKTALTYDKK